MLHIKAIFNNTAFLYKYTVWRLIMFEVSNDLVKINGNSGKYDNLAEDNSIKYGRNAANNYQDFVTSTVMNTHDSPAPILDFRPSTEAADKNIEKLDKFAKENDEYLNNLPPLQFEYRYMPNVINGQIDKKALLASAYEEMGKKTELSVDEVDRGFAPNANYTAKALDINNDGKIDNTEYCLSNLAADMFSKPGEPAIEKIDGTINEKGMNAVLEYSKKSNAAAATALYSKLYTDLNLEEAKKDFNPNV